MGGGCQSPLAAHAEVRREEIYLRGLSFGDGTQYSEAVVTGELNKSQALGQALAEQVKANL